MAKRVLEKRENSDGSVYYCFWCPGCKEYHGYLVRPKGKEGPGVHWFFDENMELPSFTPSLLMFRFKLNPDGITYKIPYERGETKCHLWVTNGRILFCADCKHDLAGKTVDMIDLDVFEAELRAKADGP